MEKRRLNVSDLVPGEALEWDVMDDAGELMRAAGQRLADHAAAAELIASGAYAHAPLPSVLGLINRAHRKLEYLLFNLAREQAIAEQVYGIAAMLTMAIERDRDIALASILLNQDEGSYAVRHCIDSAIISLLLARALDKTRSETVSIMAAALTMNVGMLQNHEQLQSRRNAISGEDVATIRAHPQRGEQLLRTAGVQDEDWLACVLLHHENEDGSGYPFGRVASDIPLCAKIVALADRYCARVSARGYRKPLLANEALSDMLVADQHGIDPMLTACFIRVAGIYPTGAVVRLASGEVGVVTRQGDEPTTPRVLALVDAHGSRLASPLVRNCTDPAFQVQELLGPEQAGFRFGMRQVWGEQARP